MSHAMTVRAHQDQVRQAGPGWASRRQRNDVVGLDKASTEISVRRLEIESADLAIEGLGDSLLSANQFRVALSDPVLPVDQPALLDLIFPFLRNNRKWSDAGGSSADATGEGR